MQNFQDELKKILPNISNLKDIGINKDLAKFGDSVTNFIYSLAKSLVIGQYSSRKVNRTILSKALKKAGMKKYAKKRSNAHALADTVEAFIGYMYCAENWSVEKMAEILVKELKNYNLSDYKIEIYGATQSFIYLLEKIKKNLISKFNVDN